MVNTYYPNSTPAAVTLSRYVLQALAAANSNLGANPAINATSDQVGQGRLQSRKAPARDSRDRNTLFSNQIMHW